MEVIWSISNSFVVDDSWSLLSWSSSVSISIGLDSMVAIIVNGYGACVHLIGVKKERHTGSDGAMRLKDSVNAGNVSNAII